MSIKETVRDISELTPTAQTACNLFMKTCKNAGLNVLITETYRSQERQNYLYEQGRTRSGNIVTWTKNSRHTNRRAWDICKNVKGHEYDDPSFFKECGKIATELGITWGGNWKNPDTPHFEIDENWKEPKEVPDMEEIKKELDFLKNSLNKIGDRITALENPMIYNYIDENMPEWARPTIEKLSDDRLIFGNEKGELNLNEDMLRILVMLDRNNVFK